jgi:hypothetical protein
MSQGLSTRPLSESDAIQRMNREVIPVARNMASRLTVLGFQISLDATQRAMTAENVALYCKRELLPLFTAIFSQTNAMASTSVVGKIGSRSPEDLPGLVLWINRTVLPKLLTAKRVLDITTL